MDAEKIIITFFGVVGFIFLIILAYYLITKWMNKEDSDKKQKTWPPSAYVLANQCPDYWVKGESNNSTTQCINKFNIPIIKSSSTRCANIQCYDEGSNNTKTFKSLTKWPVKGRKSIEDLCIWKDCCGPNQGGKIPASWVAISSTCGY
jgi:hypothetical protein